MLVHLLLSTLSVCGLTTYTNTSTSDLNSELSCTLVLNMEEISFNQSLKNIPVPDRKTYRESLIVSLDKAIKSFRWKAKFFLKPAAKQSKENFGLKTAKSPESIPELKNFENDLINMAQNIEFKQFENNLQRNLKNVCKSMDKETKLIIPADKTSNFYKIDTAQYQELRSKDVQKCYKKEKKQTFDKINKEHIKLANKLDIDDRLFKTSTQDCFITLKDHKNNFQENPQVRTLNPAKPEIGRISKKILDEKIRIIRANSQLNQWKNTQATINWFTNLKNKKKLTFILFDVEKFYPSIDLKLLLEALKWCQKYVDMSDEEIQVILAARKAMLYMDGEPWAKKGGDIFDVGMGFFDGAEICELIGLYLLEELKELGVEVGIYRDDGLAVSDLNPQGVERIKKKMSAIFRKHRLEITIEANKKRVEFLDIYMDLNKEEYGPFLKPNDTPVYVDAGSNHPPKVLENIPKGINRRLSTISASKEIFDKAAPTYQAALNKSGYKFKLDFEEVSISNEDGGKQAKKRKRNIIWFNPPYSRAVMTNVGKTFLQLMDKHFPPGNPLHQIFNRNKVKMSYRCTPNLARKISSHNAKILKSNQNTEGPKKECNCRKSDECPVEGKCLQNGVVYQATISRRDGKVDTYIGLSEPPFKDRFRNHKSSFKTRNPKNSTSLSKHIWQLEDQNIGYDISWKIVSRAKPYNPVTNLCPLCTREKYFIIFKPEMASINARNEIAGPCLHKHNKLLKKSKS